MQDMAFVPEETQVEKKSDQKDKNEPNFQVQLEMEKMKPFIKALKEYKGENAVWHDAPYSEDRNQRIESMIPERIIWLTPGQNWNNFQISFKGSDKKCIHLEASINPNGYVVTLPNKDRTVVQGKTLNLFLEKLHAGLYESLQKPKTRT
jgi:hypothetical protein